LSFEADGFVLSIARKTSAELIVSSRICKWSPKQEIKKQIFD